VTSAAVTDPYRNVRRFIVASVGKAVEVVAVATGV
jgi:hypothetical protein